MASTYFGLKNSNNYPLVLNKVNLSYKEKKPNGRNSRDAGSLFDGDFDESSIEEKYYKSQANEQYNLHFKTEPFYLDESKISFSKKQSKKPSTNNNKRDSNGLSLEKSLNRLSLLKIRDHINHIAVITSANNVSSQNQQTNKNNTKVNSIVAEILPFVTSARDVQSKTSMYNEYFDQNEACVQEQKRVAAVLPKVVVKRVQSLNVPNSKGYSRNSNYIPVPTITPVNQSLPRPVTNNITNKNKVFDLVHGINNKFIQKYLPRDIINKKNSINLSEKLPGHVALYKLMKETKGNLNGANTTELERIRREILSRNSLSQYGGEHINNDLSENFENISPQNFTFNKSTLKRNMTIHETPTTKRSTSLYVSNQSESPSLINYKNININEQKPSESVLGYLSQVKEI